VSETHVSIKVEGNQMARSHPSRTDRWNESFEVIVDKATEIEIVIYDKQVSEPHAVPIGLLWIKINDLVDALRRQKVGQEAQGGGWVTAGAMPGDSPTAMYHRGAGAGDVNAPVGLDGTPFGQGPGRTDGIDAWFAVEPAGALALELNFGM
jgi:classical protein kinase C